MVSTWLPRALSSLAVVLVSVAGCSASGTGTGDTLITKKGTSSGDLDDETPSQSSAGKGSTPPSNGSTPSGSSPTGDAGQSQVAASDQECGQKATIGSCFVCCADRYPAAEPALQADANAFGTCICETNCKTQCGTTEVCGQNGTAIAQGDACDRCLQQFGQQCDTQAGQAFTQACTPIKAACDQFVGCFQTAGCANKTPGP